MPIVKEITRKIAARCFPSKEEQIWLVLTARDKNNKQSEFARDRLWAGCERLIMKIIKKRIFNPQDYQDALHWVWLEIFIPAIEQYDPQAGFTFFNYVAHGVDIKIYRWIAQQNLIRVPEKTLLKAMKEGAKAPHLQAAINAMFVSSTDRIESNLSEEKRVNSLQNIASVTPLSKTSRDQRSPTESSALRAILTEVIRKGLETLEPKEREVIMLVFGFDSRKRYAQRHIARKIGVSRSTVGNIQKEALKKLGEYILKNFPQARILEI